MLLIFKGEVMEQDKSKKDIYSIAKENHTLMYATIELLTLCNWRCKHCYLPSHDDYGLSLQQITSIFKELRELNTFELTLTGGEIFIRKDIMDILKIARSLGFNLQLFTNVSLLNREIIIWQIIIYTYLKLI